MIKIAKEKRTFATKFKQMLMKETLKSYFGYDSFRPLQEEIIRHLLNKQDSLVPVSYTHLTLPTNSRV